MIEIYIALITGTVALLVSLFQAFYSMKKTVELEKIRSESELSKQYNEHMIEVYTRTLVESPSDEVELLKSILREFQLFKELSKMILDDGHKEPLKLNLLDSRTAKIQELYSEIYASISREAESLAHGLKAESIYIAAMLMDSIEGKSENSTDDIRRALEHFSNQQALLLSLTRDLNEKRLDKIRSEVERNLK